MTDEDIERKRHSNWETTVKQLKQGNMWFGSEENEGEK